MNKTIVRALVHAKPRSTILHHTELTSYQRLRREVLFNVWFKDSDSVQLTSMHCLNCGFACYSPRPDDDDIASKYAYLKEAETDQGKPVEDDQSAKMQDVKRADRIYEICLKNVPHANRLKVLDYGGGDGKLMAPFLNAGHTCHIIDYNDHTLPGVTKIGDDIHDCQVREKYDVILCNHVLEHVSEMSSLVKKLKGFLASDGIIYAEVPQEIWAGLGVELDPVTHINYFSMSSFSNLFLYSGFEILEKKQKVSNYGSGYLEVIWVVAKVADSDDDQYLPSDTPKMLYPSRVYSFVKFARLKIVPKLGKFLK